MKRLSSLFGITLIVFALGCNRGGSTAEQDAPANVSEEILRELPDNLRHAAFDFYGLGNDARREMQVSIFREGESDPQIMTGTETSELLGVENGIATFRIKRTGQYASLGDTEITVEPEGLFSKSSTLGEINRSLEMPADVAPGGEWKIDVQMKRPTGDVAYTGTARAVAMESITTPLGEFSEALRVEGKAQATIAGEPAEMEMTAWFVRGEGAVKTEVRTKMGGETVRQVIERVN